MNDAPAGRPKDEMKDSPREMPGATGVIDIAAFLQALQGIGRVPHSGARILRNKT